MKTFILTCLAATALTATTSLAASPVQKLSCTFKSLYKSSSSNEIKPYLVKREAPLEAFNDIGHFASLNEMLGNQWIKASASITGSVTYVQILRRDEQGQAVSSGSFSSHTDTIFSALGGEHTVVCRVLNQ